MKPELRDSILKLLDSHRLMTVATNRPDGWPQATIVAYVNDGLLLYFFVARLSQKYGNVVRDPRVSVAIGGDFSDPADIKGLSLAGKASAVTSNVEFEHVVPMFLKRFPEYADWPRPQPSLAPLMRITPEIVSVLDYSKGFGHSDLVTVEDGDLKTFLRATPSDWLGSRS